MTMTTKPDNDSEPFDWNITILKILIVTGIGVLLLRLYVKIFIH